MTKTSSPRPRNAMARAGAAGREHRLLPLRGLAPQSCWSMSTWIFLQTDLRCNAILMRSIARAGLSPLGQTSVQFMTVRQR